MIYLIKLKLFTFIFVSLQVFVVICRAQESGKICVSRITTNAQWNANDTGATEQSIFSVQVGDLSVLQVSTHSSGVFTNLSLAKKHLVKIQLDGKALTSFRFSFQEREKHLRLWYNPFYGTWSLSDVYSKEKCACPGR